MYRTCIAVIDASRARLFTLDRTADAEGLREQLAERRDLVNPARRLRDSELFSESRPGLGRSGSLQYGLDDHREGHVEGLDIEFARQITSELATLVRETAARRLILCASPRMLGHVREAIRAAGLDIPTEDVARDLVKLTPTKIQAHLVSHGLLEEPPPRAMR